MNEVVVTFFASFLIWFMFLGLAVLWVVDGSIKKEQVLHALASSMIAWVFAEMLKSFIPTTRPFFLNGLKPLTLTIPNGYAFPSSHAAVAFALAVTIWLHNKKIGAFYLIAAVLVGAARIVANVHFSKLVRKFR